MFISDILSIEYFFLNIIFSMGSVWTGEVIRKKMFEEKNETIMDDQHYSVRGISDFIQNLQQPLVYVVCAKCM